MPSTSNPAAQRHEQIDHVDQIDIETAMGTLERLCWDRNVLAGNLDTAPRASSRKKTRAARRSRRKCPLDGCRPSAVPVLTYLKISCICTMSPFHAGDLGHRRDASLAVGHALGAARSCETAAAIWPRTEAMVHRAGRPCRQAAQDEKNGLARIVGMDGRHRALVAGVHGPGSISKASSPRHSPRMIRSGRMRERVLDELALADFAPCPRGSAGRVSMRATCGC